jgi:hypothetical protein
MPSKLVINCETGVVTEYDLTEAEIVEQAKLRAAYELEIAEKQTTFAAKERDRVSAMAKLSVLGLSENEIAALLG